MDNCILCLNLTFKKNLINITTKQECGNTIDAIIKQHFWFFDRILNAEYKEKAICKTCLNKLENFNELFCAVKFNYHVDDIVRQETFETEALDEAVVYDESVGGSLKTELLEHDITSNEQLETKTILFENHQHEDMTVTNDSQIEEVKLEKTTHKDISTSKPPKSVRKSQSLSQNSFEELKEYADTKCEVCSEDLTSWEETRKHYRQIHNIIPYIRCCSKKLEKPCELEEHLMWHQHPDEFTCKTCGKLLVNKSYLLLHESKHVPPEERTFSCSKCPKKFGCSIKLRLHEKTHLNDDLEETIPCTQCPDKKFKTQKSLQSHVASIHEKTGLFLCHLCPKITNTKYGLENHVITHLESSDRPIKPGVKCNICGNYLKNRLRLRNHMRKHEQVVEGPYPCPQCDKAFKHQTALKAHIGYVHTSTKFKCTHCNKVFKHKANLNEHQSQHSGVDPYTCSFCNRTFKSNANMYKHKKRMHSKEPAKEQNLIPKDNLLNEEQ